MASLLGPGRKLLPVNEFQAELEIQVSRIAPFRYNPLSGFLSTFFRSGGSLSDSVSLETFLFPPEGFNATDSAVAHMYAKRTPSTTPAL